MLEVYAPILKWKTGEQGAIKNLNKKMKKMLYPVIMFPPIPWDIDSNCYKKTIDEHLSGFGKTLKKIWPTDQPIMLDGQEVDNLKTEDGKNPINALIDDAESNGLMIVPVISRDKSSEYIDSVNKKIEQYKRGIAIRLKDTDISNEIILSALMGIIKTDQIDLIIDYGEITDSSLEKAANSIESFCNKIDFNKYRKVILASSAFPKSLPNISPYTIKTYSRNDLNLWESLIEKNKIPRNVVFSDYGIDDPYWPDNSMGPGLLASIMMGNIRYSCKNKWYVAKGEKILSSTGYKQFYKIAKLIVDYKPTIFYGSSYSYGDQLIYAASNKFGKTGNAGSWVKAALNHHIVLTINQIAEKWVN